VCVIEAMKYFSFHLWYHFLDAIVGIDWWYASSLPCPVRKLRAATNIFSPGGVMAPGENI